MTIHEMMASKQMTMYKLAQLSGLPKTTVLDICSGKSDLAGCTAKTVWKLSKALGCTMEDLMEEAAYDTESGRPLSTNYLEKELPVFTDIHSGDASLMGYGGQRKKGFALGYHLVRVKCGYQ